MLDEFQKWIWVAFDRLHARWPVGIERSHPVLDNHTRLRGRIVGERIAARGLDFDHQPRCIFDIREPPHAPIKLRVIKGPIDLALVNEHRRLSNRNPILSEFIGDLERWPASLADVNYLRRPRRRRD